MDRGREDTAALMAAVFKNARLEIMVRLLEGDSNGSRYC